MLIRKETRMEDWLEYVTFEMNLLKLHTMRKVRKIEEEGKSWCGGGVEVVSGTFFHQRRNC